MTDARDRQLGAALRALPVPDHRPGFQAELRLLIGGRSIQPTRTRRRFGAGAGLIAAAAAAVLVVGLARRDARETATAAGVHATVVSALASADSLSGEVVVRAPGPTSRSTATGRWRFVLTSRGDYRLKGLSSATDLAYDARANVQRYSDREEGRFSETRGLAPGPPDTDAGAVDVRGSLGSAVTALGQAGDRTVRVEDYEGRPAWALVDGAQGSGKGISVTVDRETGLPVRERTPAAELRLQRLEVNEPLPTGTFLLQPGPGQEVTRADDGFERVSLADAASRVGYEPLRTEWVPDGFEAAEVAVAERAAATGDTQDPNPPSLDVVSQAFRRGLDTLVVTTRRVGDDPAAWTDPLAGGEVGRTPEKVVFSGGALDGRSGELVVDPGSVPHVWGMTDSLVVTVAGSLAREELLRVAESLRTP